MVIYCQTTGVSAAHATHCATYCTPCQPLIRAFSGWIRNPPPTPCNQTPEGLRWYSGAPDLARIMVPAVLGSFTWRMWGDFGRRMVRRVCNTVKHSTATHLGNGRVTWLDDFQCAPSPETVCQRTWANKNMPPHVHHLPGAISTSLHRNYLLSFAVAPATECCWD